MPRPQKHVEIDGQECLVTEINGIEYIDMEIPTTIIEHLKEIALSRLFGIEIIK